MNSPGLSNMVQQVGDFARQQYSSNALGNPQVIRNPNAPPPAANLGNLEMKTQAPITPPPGTPLPTAPQNNIQQQQSQAAGGYIPPQRQSGTNLVSDDNAGNNQHGGMYSFEAGWDNPEATYYEKQAKGQGPGGPGGDVKYRPGYGPGAQTNVAPSGFNPLMQSAGAVKLPAPITPKPGVTPSAPLTPTAPTAPTQNTFRDAEAARQKSMRKNPGALTY